jgi:hypothetical protein
MPLAGFEPTIPVVRRAKTFHALDRATTVTGMVFSLIHSKIGELFITVHAVDV